MGLPTNLGSGKKKTIGLSIIIAASVTFLFIVIGTANRGLIVIDTGDTVVRSGFFSTNTVGKNYDKTESLECADLEDAPNDNACGASRKSRCGWGKFAGPVCCLLSVAGVALTLLLTMPAIATKVGLEKKIKMLGIGSTAVYGVLALFCLVTFSVSASFAKENDGTDDKAGCGSCSPDYDSCGMGFTGVAYIIGWLLSMGLAALSFLFSIQGEDVGGADAGASTAGGAAYEEQNNDATPAPTDAPASVEQEVEGASEA